MLRGLWIGMLAIATLASPALAEDEDTWSFSLSAYSYLVNDGKDYVSPLITADHGRLHLEGRYNYEDINTASVFVGYAFDFGDELALNLIPMIGVVGGDTDGVAPGYRLNLTYKQFELYSEAEYLLDAHDHSDDFLYVWSELNYHIDEAFRVGIAAQRTRVNDDFDLEPGLVVGFNWKKLSFAAYAFNPTEHDRTFVFAVGYSH